ncbi:malto-oligosyltrehalose trehalohydrolase [Arcanobacterium hippocoleae]
MTADFENKYFPEKQVKDYLLMQQFKVWAPNAEKVSAYVLKNGVKCKSGSELTASLTAQIINLKPAADGVWVTDAPALHTGGTKYFLQVDAGLLLPDPRSRRQPDGIHGPSEIVDFAEFLWTDQDWHAEKANGKVFYELHIGTFTPEGTFRSAIDKLDYLVELGVEVIEIMPLNPIPGNRGWGYDGVSIMATFEPYGSPADLAALIDAMHARGLYACLDVVYNHFGPDGNYLGFYGPYLTDRHHTPWGQAVNLDGPGSEHVRRYFIDNILQWARDFHFDVFRMDAVDQLKDDSEYHIIAEISDELARLGTELGKQFTLSTESDANNIQMVTPTNQGGRGADMQWADDVHHGLHVWLTGEKNAYYREYQHDGTLEKVFTNGFYHDGIWSSFNRKIRGAKVPDSIDGHCFIVCDENHDQVGNRLVGDRPAATLPLSDLAISRALILLSPFTPMLFMGEEWATKNPFPFFTDHGAEIGSQILQGRMNEFADWDFAKIREASGGVLEMPDPQALSTFTSAKLPWQELSRNENHEFFSFVKALISLRKSDPEIFNGDRANTSVSVNNRHGWMKRGNMAVVFARDDNTEFVLDFGCEDQNPKYEVLIQWGAAELDNHGKKIRFRRAGVAIIK